MAYLEKLLIKGIRSYNPNDSNTIEFCTPMTLIIGANGTGKTTIIECLKYITTGNLPPNSKGGAFVYDARLAREVDVKAEVKLSFRDSSGNKMVCSRTLQCTQKASKIEQKTLESVVYSENDRNNPVNIKPGEGELSYYFNVSQCMLDSVIFCHQDESTWPVSEPANVKKKFDDVFSSTKYSKALEALKAAKRNSNNQIKLKYQQLEFLYKFKEKKNEIERRLSECEKDLLIKKKKEKDFSRELETCNKLLEDLNKDVEKVQKINSKLLKKREEIKNLALLKEEKLTFEEAVEISNENKTNKLEKDLTSAREKVKGLEIKLEDLEIKKAEYEKNKIEIDKIKIILSQMANKEISLEGEITSENENLMEQVEKMKEKLSQGEKSSKNLSRVEEMEDFFRMCFEDFEIQLELKQTNLEATKAEVESLKESIRNRSRILEECARSLSECEVDEDDPSVDLEDSFLDLIKNLVIKRDTLKRDILSTEESLSDLQTKYQEELKRSKEAYEINQKNLRLQKLQAQVDKNYADKNLIKNQLSENLVKMKKIKEEIKKAEETKNKAKIYQEMIKEKQEEGKREISLKTQRIKEMHEKTSKMKEEILLLSKKAEISSKQTFLKEIETSLEEATKFVGGAKIVYDTLLKVGCKKGECPVCSSKVEVGKFKGRVERIISKIPENSGKIKKLEEIYQQAKIYFKEVEETEKEELALKKYKEDLCKQEEDLLEKLDKRDLSGIVEDYELTLLDLEEDNGHLERQMGLFVEIEGLEKETRGFKPVNTAGLEEELGLVKETLMHKKKVLEGTELKIKELEKKQVYFEKVRDNRQKIQRRKALEEMQDQNQRKKEEEEADLSKKEVLMKKKAKNFEIAKENLFKKKVQIEHKLSNISEKLKELHKLKEEINKHKSKTKFEPFEEEEFNKVREEVMSHRTSIIRLQDQFMTEKQRQEEAERHIQHFENKHKREVLEKEIKKILNYSDKKQVSLEEFLEKLLGKKASLEEKKSEILQHKSLVQGEINQLTLSKKEIKKELEKEYSSVVGDYNKAYVEHKVLELSLKDLDKFINVLDKAILDFHSYKIEEVNKILKDLWVSCYKGNDIDFIELKSESLSNKTYSYRISQIKNGVELEMRGRCSAGQKMLASILVRLALAQTFGSAFNVLALDEPTTNLDRENIESLAGALVKIIQKAEKESKFQLIVITHDEDFVNLLSRESSEYFYRLTRNEKGDSQIHRHSLF